MGVKSLRSAFASPSKFNLHMRVKTPSNMKGTIIGMAEYATGWEYNVRLDGDSRHFKNRRYKENQLRRL